MLPLAFLLIMMCSGVNFFELIQLGVCYASWMCKLISFILGHFWAIFFSNILTAPFILYFLSWTAIMLRIHMQVYIDTLEYVAQVSEALFIFSLFIFFFLFLRLDNLN